MYFRLNPECYFVRGSKNGAIFDLIDGKIVALDHQETELMTICENNEPIYDGRLFRELKKLRLGNFYLNKIYVQKLRIGSPIEEQQIGNPPKLYRAFLEINNSCKRDCWFCGYYGIRRSLGCMGCNKWNQNGEPLPTEKWKKLIDDLRNLDCKSIFITGGDLTLVWDKAIDILDYANKKFDNIYIVLHKRNLSENMMSYLTDKAKIIIQTENLDKQQLDGYIYLLIVKPEDWNSVGGITSKNTIRDFVIRNQESLTNSSLMTKKKIQLSNMHLFLNNIKYHPCLGHTLAISYTGDVLPCPMMRGHKFGNVSTREIYAIFEKEWEDIYKFWGLNLDKIERCADCEFRYTCIDCRALEECLTGKIDGKRLCSYDPKEGEWY